MRAVYPEINQEIQEEMAGIPAWWCFFLTKQISVPSSSNVAESTRKHPRNESRPAVTSSPSDQASNDDDDGKKLSRAGYTVSGAHDSHLPLLSQAWKPLACARLLSVKPHDQSSSSLYACSLIHHQGQAQIFRCLALRASA